MQVIGINEYVLMNSISGMLHSVIGCQPLLVLRPTGPITLLIEKLHEASDWLSLPFWPLLAWTGMFVGLYMFLIAAFEVSRLIKYVTAFTENIFAMFIGTVYINDGVQGMIRLWSSAQADVEAQKLLVLNMTLGCTLLALFLSNLDGTSWATYRIRMILMDYALTISIFILAGVAALLNAHFFPVDFIDSTSLGFTTTAGRAWTTNLADTTPEGVLAAAVAAIPIVLFFFLDQNISSIMCQKAGMHIQKGAYYHSSFACMALFNFLGPIWGLPFVTGSLPHSPQFVHAMTVTDAKHKPVGVVENRIAPFVGYGLMMLALVFPKLISLLPETAVYGALTYVGLKAAMGTQLWERFLLFFTDPQYHPADKGWSHLPRRTVHFFTAIQLLLVVGCWLCNIYIGLGFPLFVVTLIPIRFKVLPCLFSNKDIESLLSEDRGRYVWGLEPCFSTSLFVKQKVGLAMPCQAEPTRARASLTAQRKSPRSLRYALDSELFNEAKFKMIVDGYSSPLSAGNFVDLVQRSFYNGMSIQRADGFIIQTGDPGPASGNGFQPTPGGPVRTIPLEVGLRGRSETLYGETIDEARLVGKEVKIPFQADGTVALARREFDNDSVTLTRI
ncbi:unnamed protein product [Effrenium voratum]|uniref:Uncharacterized protein n=1 Tax=Effrenium voratum TaxID=2562239 RepID=A0AA36HL96_9DINO|nr:unnamed protein product [Effrenium voratum]